MRDLTFTWNNGTANSNIYKTVKENGLKYEYNYFFELCVDLGEGVAPVTSYQIEDKLYGITYKPERTISFFDMTGEELYAKDPAGNMVEEQMLKKLHPDALPFFPTLKLAIEHSRQLEDKGYKGVKILEKMDNTFAVIIKQGIE